MINKYTFKRLTVAIGTIFFHPSSVLANALPPIPIIALEQAELEGPQALETIASSGTIYYAGMWRALVSLAVVIGLIYLTAWVYKKLNNFNAQNIAKSPKNLDTNKFKLLSTQALGANKNLHVVEINGKYLVIGSTANNISLIKEFDKRIVDFATSESEKPSLEETFQPSKLLNDEYETQPMDKQLKRILDKYKDLT